MRWLILCVVTVAGCESFDAPSEGAARPKTAEDVQDNFEERMETAKAETLGQLHSPSCLDRGTASTCGMISTDLRRGGAKRFIEGTCGESIEAPSHACIDRLQTTFRTALLRRYSHAIKGEIEIACNEDPDECSTMELVERRYIESHNHSLVAEWERRKLAITQDFRRDRKNVRDAERAQAQADEADRQARERLRSFGAAMQKAFEKPPTNVVYMKECRLDADCPNNGHCFKQDTFSGICAAR